MTSAFFLFNKCHSSPETWGLDESEGGSKETYLSDVWGGTGCIFVDNLLSKFLHDLICLITSSTCKLFHYPGITGNLRRSACPCAWQGLPYSELHLYLPDLFSKETKTGWYCLTVIELFDWVSLNENKSNENGNSEEVKIPQKRQWELKVRTSKQLKPLENAGDQFLFGCSLQLIGWKSGASFLFYNLVKVKVKVKPK